MKLRSTFIDPPQRKEARAIKIDDLPVIKTP
jgi:hypothetical protein